MYPATMDALVTDADPDSVLEVLGGVGHTTLHNTTNDAVNRVQNTLGVNPQGTRATVSDRIANLESIVGGGYTPPDLSVYLNKTAGGTVTGATTFYNLTANALTIAGPTTGVTATFTAVKVSSLQILDGATYRALNATDVGAIPVTMQNSLVLNSVVTEQALLGPIKSPKVTASDMVTGNLDAQNLTGVFQTYRITNSGIDTPMLNTTTTMKPLITNGAYAMAVKALSSAVWVTTSGLLTGGQPQIAVGVVGPYDSEAAAYGDWTAGATDPISGTKLNFGGGSLVSPLADYTGIAANLGDFGVGSYSGQDYISGLTVGKWYLIRPLYRNLSAYNSKVASFRMRVETALPGEKSL